MSANSLGPLAKESFTWAARWPTSKFYPLQEGHRWCGCSLISWVDKRRTTREKDETAGRLIRNSTKKKEES